MKIYQPKADYKALLEDMRDKLKAEAEEQKANAETIALDAWWLDLTGMSPGESLYSKWMKSDGHERAEISRLRDIQAGKIDALLKEWDVLPERKDADA